MKNKGFTLVEMLAVIIIMALIGTIGIISVESIIKKGTEKAYEAQMSEIKSAAENLIKVDGEPVWCKENAICFISIRYLAYNKYIKLNENGDYINPKLDEPFSLETGALIKKYDRNYIIEAYDNVNAISSEYLNQAKMDVLKASALIYKERGFCSINTNCSIKTSDLINKNLLESNFYSEVNITINEFNQINIG